MAARAGVGLGREKWRNLDEWTASVASATVLCGRKFVKSRAELLEVVGDRER